MPAKTKASPAREAKRAARLTQIVDDSARLFARSGYQGTGLAALCEAVGLGRGAFYYHIESKENLLGLIHDRVMDRLFSGAEAILDRELDPVSTLEALGADLTDIVVSYPDHVWVFLHEFHSLTGERAARFRKRRTEYEQIIQSVLENGVADGQFDIADARLATLAWLGMHNYSYIWARSAKYGAETIAKHFANIYIDGITKGS